MSTDNFVKGECRHCAGHLEFPAHAAGETIECPHCGQQTVLTPQNATVKSNRRLLVGFFIGLILVVGLTMFFFLPKKLEVGQLPQKLVVPVLVVKPSEPVDVLRTNHFGISAFKLEKAPGSSLVYVIGTLRNLSDQQRFGVKVEFSLLDTNGQPLGKATDYNRQLEAHASWVFKAMVLESKATTARLETVTESP
jgi:hypothetical protein